MQFTAALVMQGALTWEVTWRVTWHDLGRSGHSIFPELSPAFLPARAGGLRGGCVVTH
jgi:hypothetical protein